MKKSENSELLELRLWYCQLALVRCFICNCHMLPVEPLLMLPLPAPSTEASACLRKPRCLVTGFEADVLSLSLQCVLHVLVWFCDGPF